MTTVGGDDEPIISFTTQPGATQPIVLCWSGSAKYMEHHIPIVFQPMLSTISSAINCHFNIKTNHWHTKTTKIQFIKNIYYFFHTYHHRSFIFHPHVCITQAACIMLCCMPNKVLIYHTAVLFSPHCPSCLARVFQSIQTVARIQYEPWCFLQKYCIISQDDNSPWYIQLTQHATDSLPRKQSLTHFTSPSFFASVS